MSRPFEILSERILTAVEFDTTGTLLRFGPDCTLRLNVPVHIASGNRDLAQLVGGSTTALHVDDVTFSMTIDDTQLSVRIDDIELGIVEAIVLSTPSVIAIWP